MAYDYAGSYKLPQALFRLPLTNVPGVLKDPGILQRVIKLLFTIMVHLTLFLPTKLYVGIRPKVFLHTSSLLVRALKT